MAPPPHEIETLTEEDRFRLLVESVKDYGIFMLSPTGNVQTWNAGAERLNGYASHEIIGRHFSVFYPTTDVEAGKCENDLLRATVEGRFEEEGWRLRKDGSRFWSNVVITALRDADGSLVGFAKVTRDLTERRANEQHQEFQERFIAILGHDLRNPLAALDMGVTMLAEKLDEDPAVTRVLQRMDASCKRMSKMIEQILDLTRSRLVGGLEVSPTQLELCGMIGEVVDELRVAHPSRAIDLRCVPAHGEWDRDRLEQVFSNLIGNALHYGPPDQPIVVALEPEEDGVRVDVQNQGPPIPPQLQEQIFSPFRRGTRDSRTPSTAGLGLGLYISREIVVAHGGDIHVHSSNEAGTTFRVRLPWSLRQSEKTA